LRQEDFMSTPSGSLLERVIRAISRGAVPIDASQCDGACVVNAPADAHEARFDGDADRQAPIRWLSLR
jgi:hypothetical protein